MRIERIERRVRRYQIALVIVVLQRLLVVTASSLAGI